jgi:anti-sigma regulatory factor (Ser/Thr protein kinase)
MSDYCVVTTDNELFNLISENLGSRDCGDTAFCINHAYEAASYMCFELPEMIFVNFSDKGIDSFVLLEAAMEDPWLLNSGIIAICETVDDAKRIEKIQGEGVNIIVSIDRKQIRRSLSTIMSIIRNNRRILFQRGLSMDIMDSISGSFMLKNDFLEVQCYTNLICNFLFNTKKINKAKKMDLQIALTEMLLNAVEHGNCGIGFEKKTQWLRKGEVMETLIRQRVLEPEVQRKQVLFEYSINPVAAHFRIVDEGEGFDSHEPVEPSFDRPNGRGIIMTRSLTHNLVYNDKGNALTFEFVFNQDESGLIPGLLVNIDSRKITKGEVIFCQGESGSHLYYIVSGHYDVIVDGKVVSCLNSDDIFMGEMSFLLKNHRSATVQAKTEGRLIEVSKREFVQVIKDKPYYALFLTKLLAKRIQRVNAMV